MPLSVVKAVTPFRPQKKSKCHQERRNSPSVASLRPTSCCRSMIFSISRSSTVFNAAASISPLTCLARASFSGAVRNRLPTWSARNGGLVRWVIDALLSPDFLGQIHQQLELGPLLPLGQHIALLGRGKAALRRQAELIEPHELRRLLNAPLDIVARLEPSGFRGDQPEHHPPLSFGQEAQRFETARAVGVVFEEIAVVIALAEQVLRHGLVAAGRDKGGAEIAAADMSGDGHVLGLGLESLFDSGGVALLPMIDVKPAVA